MAKDLKVVLLGYMASGKSTIGNLLAQRLKVDFIDLDNEIEQHVGISIAEIFATKGELFFRKKESEVLDILLTQNKSFVLSLGGGTPCYGENMQNILNKTNHSFYLKLSIAQLLERILKEKSGRPLVANIPDGELPEFLGKHLFERGAFYLKADTIINCDSKTAAEVCSEITEALI